MIHNKEQRIRSLKSQGLDTSALERRDPFLTGTVRRLGGTDAAQKWRRMNPLVRLVYTVLMVVTAPLAMILALSNMGSGHGRWMLPLTALIVLTVIVSGVISLLSGDFSVHPQVRLY